MADRGPVVVMNRATPRAVLISPERWNQIARALFRVRCHELARKIEAKNETNRSWITHEQVLAKLEAKYGPEFIAAYHAEVAVDVAG